MIKHVAFLVMGAFAALWLLLRPKTRDKWRWVPLVIVMTCGVVHESRFVESAWPWDIEFWRNLRPPLYSSFSEWDWHVDWLFLVVLAVPICGLIVDFWRRRIRHKERLSEESGSAGSCLDGMR